MSNITVNTVSGLWTVRVGGAVIAETTHAAELIEGTRPPVYYFPRNDIAMDLLDKSTHTSECPHKGKASYFSIVTKSKTLENAAWSYENPKEAVAKIAGCLAFAASDEVTVEKI